MSLEACVAAVGELLVDEPELLADFTAVFAGPRPRWRRMPEDLRLGLADIAWDHLVARGLAPAPGDRTFILRGERRCGTCGGAPPVPSYRTCEDCAGTGRDLLERRDARPPSLSVALALAGDAEEVLAAEALAREATARLWPWRGRRGAVPGPGEPPRTIAWRVDESGAALELMRGTRGVCPLLFEVLTRAAHERRTHASSHELYMHSQAHHFNRRSLWPPAPTADRAAEPLYAELAASGARVPEYGLHGSLPRGRADRPYPPIGRAFAELANPFTPLCALWDRGVALERLEADTIVLARGLDLDPCPR